MAPKGKATFVISAPFHFKSPRYRFPALFSAPAKQRARQSEACMLLMLNVISVFSGLSERSSVNAKTVTRSYRTT